MIDILIITAINVALYYRTLGYGLVIDDIDWLSPARGQRLLDWKYGWATVLKSRLYGAGTFGDNLVIDHTFTLTLHIVTALLIAHIFNPIAAILWSVHPGTHQTSIWLNGRRYSILNIIFLLIVMFHAWYVLIALIVGIGRFAYTQLNVRYAHGIPLGKYNPLSVLFCICESCLKLSGFNRPMFLYSYKNVAPFLPFTQPCAERYLSIPLILFCAWMATTPQIGFILVPMYCVSTFGLMPMYRNIQSFYDYHKKHLFSEEKLALLRRLYPIINNKD